MKIAFLLISLLISMSAHAERGGITAGGGDISVPDSIDQPSLQKMIVDSKFTLIQWANYSEYWWLGVNKPSGGLVPESVFLFERADSVFEWIRRTEIRVENHGPCKDGVGRDTDGSAHDLPNGIICISAQRLGTKLSALNYEYEVAALIMHEIVHLMGGDEAMALLIQKDVVQSLNGKRRFEIYLKGNIASTKLAQAAKENSEMIKRIQSFKQLEGLQKSLNLISFDLSLGGLTNPLRSQSQTILEDLSTKIAIVQEFLQSRDPSLDPKVRRVFAERYALAFASAKEGEILVRNYQPLPNSQSNPGFLKTKKITDRKGVERELRDVLDNADQLAKEIDGLAGLGFITHPN
jgi:hypothetical protein